MNDIVIDRNHTSLHGKYCSVHAILKTKQKQKIWLGVKMKETLASFPVKTHVCFGC